MFSCNGQICAPAVRSGSMESQDGGAIKRVTILTVLRSG